MLKQQGPVLLGPFVGHVTESTAKVWVHVPDLKPGESRTLSVTLHTAADAAATLQAASLELTYEGLGAGIARFDGLSPDTEYFYRVAGPDGRPLELDGLLPADLHFRTLPSGGFDDQLDFLLMSCHNPETAADDGCDGFAVWACIPRIMAENKNVRFALLIGDQIYGDDVEAEALKEPDLRKRQALYLGTYRRFWGSPHYRRVLCSLPAVMMWDDHDITDGWGSREDSFTDASSTTFQPQWLQLFEAARSVFERMQATRNPDMLSAAGRAGYDCCFRIGRAAFVVPDLRSNRNIRQGRVWLPEQLASVRQWVEANRSSFDTLFFASSVVFSHGDPGLDQVAVENWPVVLRLVAWLAKKCSGLGGLVTDFNKNVGDLRDDIEDSWGAQVNREQTDQVLDWLFGLQNPPPGEKPVNVVILSGDIHTPGYSTIYSSDPLHPRAVIPHVVASPVAYKPFSWVMEALYRHLSKVVTLGAKGTYTAQVSHHYCHRNVAVVSLRRYGDAESHLKAKFYLEGFPEPEVVLFDLNRGSHREAIEWPASPKTARTPLSI